MALDRYSHEGKEVLADGGGGMGTVQGGQRPISKRPALEQGAEHANAIPLCLPSRAQPLRHALSPTSTSKVNWANSQWEHSAKSAACGPTRLPKDLAPILNETNVTEPYGSKAPPR